MSAHRHAQQGGERSLPAEAGRVHGRPHLALCVEDHNAFRDRAVMEASRHVAAPEAGHHLGLSAGPHLRVSRAGNLCSEYIGMDDGMMLTTKVRSTSGWNP